MKPNEITKNKTKIEADLELLRGLINKTNDAIFVVDPQSGCCLFVNDQACASLGYDRQELLKITVKDIETTFPDNFLWQTHVDGLRQKGSQMLEGIHKRKDRTTFPVETNVSYVVLNTREYMVAVVRDITERKQAAEALRESEDWYRRMVELSPDAIFINVAGKFVFMNAMGARLFGVEHPEDLYGRTVLEFIHPDFREIVRVRSENSLEHGASNPWLEEVYLRLDGSAVPVEVAAMSFSYRGEKAAHVIARDISERKKMHDDMLRTQKLESLGVLAGGIAHDFNNLLQGVFGYISIAKLNAADKDKSVAALDQAEKALHMSVNLTTQLLIFSKGGKPVKKKMSLQPMIENSARFALSGSSADYQIKLDKDLWQVEADEGQIGQVIQNIVLNADQSMPMGGTIVITAKNLHASKKVIPQLPEEGKYVVISVQDNGTGISEECLSKIFDPYFTTKAKGSGLGLATCYSIIKNHGGVIHVSSKVGKGTTFYVYLPAIEAKKDAPQPPQLSLFVRKAKILLMDDEELIRNIAGEMIDVLGHKVELAEHGEEVIEKYNAAMESGNPFDVVILDLTIRGGMGGRETIERLLAVNPRIRAIVSSGYSDDAVVSDYRNYGFSARLTKPYKLQELSDTLNNLLIQ
jgi:PAS domain S-box-containing protein